MSRALQAVAVAAAVLALLAGCSDDGAGPPSTHKTGADLVGYWAYMAPASSVPVYGIRITPDFEIEVLGVEWSTGRIASTGWNPLARIVDVSPFGQVTLEEDRSSGITPPDNIIRVTYDYTATATTLRLDGPQLSRFIPAVEYHRVEPGEQVIAPVASTLGVEVSGDDGDYHYESAAVSRELSAAAHAGVIRTSGSEFLQIQAYDAENGTVQIALLDFAGPGTYVIDVIDHSLAFWPPLPEFFDYVPTWDAVSGTVTIETYDVVNRRCAGSFEAELVGPLDSEMTMTNGTFDLLLVADQPDPN